MNKETRRAGRATRLPGIRMLGEGIYLVRARGYDEAGKRIERERRVQATSVKEAQDRQRDLERELTAGVGASASLLFGAAAEAWVAAKTAAKRANGDPRLAPTTAGRYRQVVRDLIVPTLGGMRLETITKPVIERWRDALGSSFKASTTNGALRVLRTILRDSGSTAADTVKPLLEDDTRITDDAPNLLDSEEQIAALLSWVRRHEPEHFALIGLLVTTGLRISTALALTRADFEPEKGVIVARRRRSGKEVIEGVKRSRTARDVVPLVPWVWDAVRARWAGHNERQRLSGLAFAGKGGGHMARSHLDKPLKAATAALGLPKVTPHGLRRTSALLYRLRSGQAMSKAISGHLTDAMNAHYAPVRTAERAAAGRAVFGGLLGEELGEKGVGVSEGLPN